MFGATDTFQAIGRTAKHQPELLKKADPDLQDDASSNNGQTVGRGYNLHAAQALNLLGGHPSVSDVPLALEVDIWLFRLGCYLAALYGGLDIYGELVDHH